MKLLSLNGIGTQGINTDLPEWNLPLEYITNGENFRIIADAVENVPSETVWADFTLPVEVSVDKDFLTDVLTGSPSTPISWGVGLNTIVSAGQAHLFGALAYTEPVYMNQADSGLVNGDYVTIEIVVSDIAGGEIEVWADDFTLASTITTNGTYIFNATIFGTDRFAIYNMTPGTTAILDSCSVLVSQSPDSRTGHILFAGVSSGDYWITAGRDIVSVWDGLTFSNISSTAGYSPIGIDQELDWNSCMLGSIPILNNKQVHPEYWSPQDTVQPLQPLQFDVANTWLDMGYSFSVIRSHKNFLFALDLVEGGIEFPNSYRWSHPADINGLPFTWDENDLSSLASKEQLGGDTGRIIDGLSLRDAFCIYSERGIDILDYTGGDFVFRRRRLSSTIGVLSTNSIVEIKGVHYFIGDGDIYANNGNTIQSIGHDNIRKRLNQNGSGDFYSRSFTVKNILTKEIWFCVPENGAKYVNTAYVLNYIDKTWGIQDLPANTAHAAYGSKSEAPITWDNVTDTWDSIQTTWAGSGSQPLNDRIISVDNLTGNLIDVDPTGTTSAAADSFIERLNMPLEGVRDVVTITRIFPHITGDPVTIQFGGHAYSGSGVTWSDAIVYDPAVDRKIDLRITGALVAWRVSSIGTGLFRLSGFNCEYANAGQR